MAISGRRIRPLVAMAFVGLGGFGGFSLANWYIGYVAAVLRGEGNVVLPWIAQNPTRLGPADKMWLRIALIAIGGLVGFVLERLAYQQAKAAQTRWDKMAPADKVVFFVGILVGLVLTALIRSILGASDIINVSLAIILCYLSVIALESLKEQIRFYFPEPGKMTSSGGRPTARPKLLDTNVIIDGRIADICRAGFVEGPIYIPRFVLDELQQIADSGDSLKRARGRRGLDILNQMQKEMDLEVPDTSVGEGEEVDARLVLFARDVNGAIVTNDFNLNRVAELQGVDVMNVNELANALKPVVLPGEEMSVTIIKEGKEKEQGIGYLDDGTMIVVEGARRLINETLDVNVTSVLQTVQGKMIFAKMKDGSEEGGDSVERNVSSYTSSRFRRKTR